MEGAADKPIVEGIFARHYKEFRGKILVNGSLSESKDAFLARFYDCTGLPYIVLLDADSGGRDLLKELKSIGIPLDKIVQLENVFTGRGNDFAMEDILSADFYHKAVQAAYPSHPVDLPPAGSKKRATRYEEAFRAAHNIGFNKKRVAESARKLIENGSEDEETKTNLGTLSGTLVESFKRQIPAGTPTAAAAESKMNTEAQPSASD